jgi:prephenate dehydrogenase
MINVKQSIVLGGRGAMAQMITPHLPRPLTLVDPIDFADHHTAQLGRVLRRYASTALRCGYTSGDRRRHHSVIDNLCLISIPAAVYEQTIEMPEGSRLSNLLGISARGYSNTLFVHQTSVHSTPAAVLDSASGVSLGLHLLHGPMATDAINQTAIITASDSQKNHDRYKPGESLLKTLLNTMGYLPGRLFIMSPQRHDRIMTNIQFLTHSMVLILNNALKVTNPQKGSDYISESKTAYTLRNMARRMSAQPSHVYKGIARGNAFNLDIIERLKHINIKDNNNWLSEAIHQFGKIRDELEAEMTTRERMWISTPMSRWRDELIDEVRKTPQGVYDDSEVNLNDEIHGYINALNTHYDAYFRAATAPDSEKNHRFC